MNYQSKLLKNIIIVTTGTAGAQALTMLTSPIITRLYGPQVYGILGVFIAIVSVVSPVAALTYPKAIVLPKDDADAKSLIKVSLYISLCLSIIVTILIIFLKPGLVTILNSKEIAPFLFLIPIVIVFSSILQVTQQWLIRKKKFKVSSQVIFFNSLFLNSAKILGGVLYPIASTLIILSTLNIILNALMLSFSTGIHAIKKTQNIFSYEEIKKVSKLYKDFPSFRAPQTFINSMSQNLPILLLAIFFGPVSSGFYTLSKTILGTPTSVIGKAIGDVFYPRINEAMINEENVFKIIQKSTFILLGLGLIPFSIIFIFGPSLFEFFFGKEWFQAGEYARWLGIFYYFVLVSRPVIVAIPVLKLQKGFLLYEVISTILKVLALMVGFFFYTDDVIAIACFSLTSVIGYICLIAWVSKWSLKV